MAMTDLAAQGAGALVPLSDIASRQRISLSFLEQLFRQIRRAGLIESQRGAKGGYRLEQAAANITLDQIILAVDEPIKTHGCTPEARHGCTGSAERCLTHDLWGALESHIGAFMSSVTLADVLAGRVTPSVIAADMEAAE